MRNIQLSGNFDLAEDLTQETFYQAYKSIHRYNGKCKVSVWLCQIAKHIQISEFQNLELFENVNLEGNIEENYLIKERIKELLFAVKQTKEPYGKVFWLRAYEEMSFREIGEIFDKSENWARVNYYRAKKKIREVLIDENNM